LAKIYQQNANKFGSSEKQSKMTCKKAANFGCNGITILIIIGKKRLKKGKKNWRKKVFPKLG
jgi:hypothetical protein